jgi:hypothetical protein
MAIDITAEDVLDSLCGGDNDFHDGLGVWFSLWNDGEHLFVRADDGDGNEKNWALSIEPA